MLAKRIWLPAVLLAWILSSSARADDVALLSTKVPPNVMLFFDTSGSMATVLFSDAFYSDTYDPDGSGSLASLSASQLFWPSACGVPLTGAEGGSSCPGSTYLVGDAIDGDTDLLNDPCPLNADPYNYTSSDITPGCGKIGLPDYSDSGATWWPYNYLNWLLPRLLDTDPTNDGYLLEVRSDAGAAAYEELIQTINPDVVDNPNDSTPTYTERVRFGLARFNSDNGANITGKIETGNKNSLISRMQNLTPSGATPISEALVDIGRYFAGPKRLCDPTDGTPCYQEDTNGTPIDLACRRSFTVLMTDGQPTGDQHTGNDQRKFGDIIGNYDLDGDECAPETGPQPKTCIQDPDDGRDDGVVWDSTGSDFLDDVAKYLFEYDLSPLAGQQNLVTYTLGFATDHPLLKETATAGDGLYYRVTSKEGLLEALTSAVIDIIARAGSFTAASVPSSRSTLGDGFYTAFFEPSSSELWRGHLQAYTLTPEGEVRDRDGNLAIDPATGLFVEPRNPWWDAGDVLADANAPARNLWTTRSGAQVALSTATEAELGLVAGDLPSYPNYPDSGVDTTAELRTAVLNYLSGLDAFDEDDDSDSSEKRGIVLGDIFHSNPSVVGPPTAYMLGEPGFAVATTADDPFRIAWAHRDRVVYAGANDGMLHAFHGGDWYDGDNPDTAEAESGYFTPGTGVELFGYVPGLLLDDVRKVPLNRNHRYFFMDGSPTIADVWLGDPNDPNDVTKTPDEWATVLVAGFREGGAGYLALDVTNPDASSASDPHGPYPKFLWEFTHAQLGEAWSEPVLTRVKVPGATGSGDHCGRDDGDGDCREQWVAIFGAGFTDQGNPNGASFDAASTVGKGIFMVSLDTGALIASVLYDPNATTDARKMNYAIPSMPAVLDLDFDGFADMVSIGDLGGQLWKWDIHSVGVDADADGSMEGWSFGVFFDAGRVAISGTTYHYRSIFFPPAASFHADKLMLALGTGERDDMYYPGVANRDDQNRFYVIRDDVPIGSGAFSAGTHDEGDLTDISGANSDTTPSDQGFFFRLADAEKFVSSQLVFAGYVIAATYTPFLSDEEVCDRSGSARLYVFDVATGLGFYFEQGVTEADGARSTSIGLGAPSDPRLSISMTGEQLYVQTSTGEVALVEPPDPGSLARTVYWRHRY